MPSKVARAFKAMLVNAKYILAVGQSERRSLRIGLLAAIKIKPR